jgi:hypothetical protein
VSFVFPAVELCRPKQVSHGQRHQKSSRQTTTRAEFTTKNHYHHLSDLLFPLFFRLLLSIYSRSSKTVFFSSFLKKKNIILNLSAFLIFFLFIYLFIYTYTTLCRIPDIFYPAAGLQPSAPAAVTI